MDVKAAYNILQVVGAFVDLAESSLASAGAVASTETPGLECHSVEHSQCTTHPLASVGL